MTTNPTPIPEPTSLTSVAVGKRDGETVLTDISVVSVAEMEARPTKVSGCARCDRIEAHALGIEGLLGRRRDQLAKAREEIDQLKARIDELEAAKPEPSPWLRGDELGAVMPMLKADDVVEVEHRLHGKFSGGLVPRGEGALALAGLYIRTVRGEPNGVIDALRVVERAPEPEPGADIPDEVVEAAWSAFDASFGGMRDALAAADAKRTELDGGKA